LILAGVGLVLVQSSMFDLKLAGASQMKQESTTSALGAVDSITNKATEGTLPTSGDLVNMDPANVASLAATDIELAGTSASLEVLKGDNGLSITQCPFSHIAHDTSECVTVRVNAEHSYGGSQAAPASTSEALLYQRNTSQSN